MAWSIFTDGGGQGAAVTWADRLLHKIGAPVTPGNEQVVYDWEVSEGGGGRYNPLNQGPDPSHPSWSGGSQYGGGASDYTSWATGLQGASDYLHMPAYRGILGALRSSNSNQARNAIISSPWAASHYGNGASFATTPLPGKKQALKGGKGGITTTAKVSASNPSGSGCPSIFVSPAAWATCNALGGSNNPLAGFFIDPVDALERIGLVVLGALLLIIGIAILGFGPASRALSMTSGTAGQVSRISRTFTGSNSRPPADPAVAEERSRRLALAEKNASLGERKLSLKEARERRLQMGASYRAARAAKK